jgi:hypothetical protein
VTILELVNPAHFSPRPQLHQVAPPLRRCSLYRQYDDHGILLYVGISADVAARRTSHLKHSAWVEFAAMESATWYDSVTAAAAAEVEAITTELPLFNTAHAVAGRDDRLRDYLVERGAWHLLTRHEVPAPPDLADLPYTHLTRRCDRCRSFHVCPTDCSPEPDPERTRRGAQMVRAALHGWDPDLAEAEALVGSRLDAEEI